MNIKKTINYKVIVFLHLILFDKLFNKSIIWVDCGDIYGFC